MSAAPVVTHRHIAHAAHDFYSGLPLWDLDMWDVQGRRSAPRPVGVPADTEYDSGFIGMDCLPYSRYTRKAPASPGRCARCTKEKPQK